jgi:hypothetical protein
VPRLDYPLGGAVNGCPALLVEPSAQNAFIESQTLFTAHLPLNLTTTGYTNAETSPDGSVTAEKFVPNTTLGVHGIANGSFLAITSGTTYTLSLFVKSDGGPYNLISLTFDSSTAWGATRNCIFNASNGTNFAVPSGATMTSENYGNGWYRIRATLTAVGNVAATQYQYRIYVADASGNLSWLAPSGNTNGIFCWGAQLEVGSVPTSYIPTTTAAVTRSAENVFRSTSAGLIGTNEGTIYAEVLVRANSANSSTRRIINIRADGSNVISLELGSTGLGASFIINSTAGGNKTIGAGTLVAGVNKIAAGYSLAAQGMAVYLNGVFIASDTLTAIPNLQSAPMGIGIRADLLDGSILNDRIRAFEIYPNRIPNTAAAGVLSLATLTAP